MEFTCAFGEDDCMLSRVQLCAIDYLDGDEDRIMNFIICQMDNNNGDLTGAVVSGGTFTF